MSPTSHFQNQIECENKNWQLPLNFDFVYLREFLTAEVYLAGTVMT